MSNMSNEAQWSQLAAGQSGAASEAPPGGGAQGQAQPQGAPTMTMEPEGKRGRRGRKEKREKQPKVKAEKAPRAPRMGAAPQGGGGSWDSGLLSLSDAAPSREELERQAADELLAALGPSYQLLRQEVPDAASPDDAQRQIESKLGPAPRDNDAAIPKHPIYSGDSLVYYQLRRHYGQPHAGGSYQRSWYPGA